MNGTLNRSLSCLKRPAASKDSSPKKTKTFVLVPFIFFAMLAWVFSGNPVQAEEGAQEDLPDRLKLYGGYQLLFGIDGKFRLDGNKTGLGSTFDFDDDLGGDEHDKMLRAGLRFRFNENHGIGFSWYDINLQGDRTLDDALQINDDIFQIGARVKSKVDLTLYRLFYNWSFYHSDKTELILSPGMYFGDFAAKFEGSAVIDADDMMPVSARRTVKESLFAPLPTIGMGVEYKIFPRLQANLRMDFFYVDISDVEGTLAELYVGLEYRILKHFAVGAAYDRMMLDLEYKSGKPKGWAIDASWNGGFFYGALYF